MSDRVVLQVPMSLELRTTAEEGAHEMGFSSFQDAVRLFASKVASRSINFSFHDELPTITLSAKNARRYDKIMDDALKGKNVQKFDSVAEMLKSLHAK